MIEQLNIYDTNVLTFEVIGHFTEADQKIFQKLFDAKRKEGFDRINVLIKLNELKVTQVNVKAFFEDILWTIRNFKHLGHIAIVAHSNVVKALVPIDNLFFVRAGDGREERYFDISQIDDAFKFVGAG